MRAINSVDLEGLALALDRDGVSSHDDEMSVVAARARRACLSPTLAAIVSAPDAPEVARLRAFGRLAALLEPSSSRPPLALAS
jgi:hypothetical protein